jgi:catechol 2,3-dioxygenase-like lactoylglutathione lyase family enzyme
VISAELVVKMMVTIVAFALCTSVVSAEPSAHIDHIILGVSDLDQGIDTFAELTGVRPVYGGKHPVGTHNALVSLGGRTYLEIIAVQPGASPPAHFADLSGLKELTPVGWAVSSDDLGNLRSRLLSAGLALTDPQEGSRVTPSGSTLRWQTFGLQEELYQAPFFIVWDAESPHPSSTSPTGCSLEGWTVAGPNQELLERLGSALELPLGTARAPAPAMILTLACPKGSVLFEFPVQHP